MTSSFTDVGLEGFQVGGGGCNFGRGFGVFVVEGFASGGGRFDGCR